MFRPDCLLRETAWGRGQLRVAGTTVSDASRGIGRRAGTAPRPRPPPLALTRGGPVSDAVWAGGPATCCRCVVSLLCVSTRWSPSVFVTDARGHTAAKAGPHGRTPCSVSRRLCVRRASQTLRSYRCCRYLGSEGVCVFKDAFLCRPSSPKCFLPSGKQSGRKNVMS